MTLRIYGDTRSGNCLKVRWTADKLGLAYEWMSVDVLDGTTRQGQFLRLNPAGQIPLLVLEDGQPLAQSNAIIAYLAEGSVLIPRDAYARAKMFEWMFWEQYSHEPYIAVARFHRKLLGKSADQIPPRLMQRGEAALARMEKQLEQTRFLVDEAFSLADISLVAYTRVAPEGGFDLDPYPALRGWIARVEAELRIG